MTAEEHQHVKPIEWIDQPDRDVDQLRRRFIEGLRQGLRPGALRRFVVTGIRPDERSGSGRKRRSA